MGKKLIIKNADFSVNAIDNASPVFPVNIDLTGRYIQDYAYVTEAGEVVPVSYSAQEGDPWKYTEKISIPNGATKIIGTYYTPNRIQVTPTSTISVMFIGFYNNNTLLSNVRPSQSGNTENINVTIPANSTSFVMCFRLGFCNSDYLNATLPVLEFDAD